MGKRKTAGRSARKRVGRVSYYCRRGTWHLYYRDGRRPVRRRVADNEADAARAAAVVNGQLAAAAPTPFSFTPLSVAELRRRFLDHHEQVLRSSLATVRRYRSASLYLERFVADRRGPAAAHTVEADEFCRYLRSVRVAANGHPHAARRALKEKGIRYILEVSRSLYGFAAKKRHLPPYTDNPFAGLGGKRTRQGDAKRVFVFDEPTELAFLRAADAWGFPVQFTLAKTGLRPGELIHLLVEELDFDAGWLHVRNKPELGWQIKTGRERAVPLVAELVELLRRVVGGRTGGPVFLRRAFCVDRSELAGAGRRGLKRRPREGRQGGDRDRGDRRNTGGRQPLGRGSSAIVYVVYEINDDPQRKMVSVSIFTTPNTRGKLNRPTASSIESGSLYYALDQLLAEIKAGLVPPTGGRILAVPSTGETALVGFGSAVVETDENAAEQARLHLSAQKVAVAHAQDSLCGMIIGDKVTWEGQVIERHRNTLASFDDATQGDPVAKAGSEAFRRLETRRASTIPYVIHEEQDVILLFKLAIESFGLFIAYHFVRGFLSAFKQAPPLSGQDAPLRVVWPDDQPSSGVFRGRNVCGDVHSGVKRQSVCKVVGRPNRWLGAALSLPLRPLHPETTRHGGHRSRPR